MSINKQIREARIKQGRSLRGLSARTGISAGFLSAFETGKRTGLGPFRLHRLCSELGITPVTPANSRDICSLHALEVENARLRDDVDALRRALAILRAAMVEADAITVSPPPKGEL